MPDPIFVILDIDGTLIGDISFCVCEWEILSRIDHRKLRQLRAFLISYLKSGLLRSGIADFLTNLRSVRDDIEFIIYTASDDKWASFLVPCIESAIGIKLARPIFTRKDCVGKSSSSYKSLAKISQRVFRAFKTKYPALKSEKHVAKMMVMIDNNHVLREKEVSRCIICPTYDYCTPYDVLKNADAASLSQNYKLVCEILHRYDLIPSHTLSHIDSLGYHGAMSLYHAALSKSFKSFVPRLPKDSFWYSLSHDFVAGLKKDQSLDSIIKHIKKKL